MSRKPTSHERRHGQSWDASYRNGVAPWDIGGPQPAIVRVAAQGRLAGPLLDAGCGTGENTLHIAALGVPVLGVDVAETALAMARQKAAERGIPAEFALADALHLDRLARTFRTVVDCGLFHTFDGEERLAYVASLASVTAHGGAGYVLCFSDSGPDPGPHPVSEKGLRAAFSARHGWSLVSLEQERILTRFHTEGAAGWLATVARR